MSIEENSSPLKLRWSALTHPGKIRTNNEDCFLALSFDQYSLQFLGMFGEVTLKEFEFVFAVGDGMGGEKAGEYASRVAIDKISRILPAGFRKKGSSNPCLHNELLEKLYKEVHKELEYMGQAYADCKKMGTTLSLCWLTPEKIHFAHIGDSRIYHLPKNGIAKQITQDHTHAGWLFRKGQINEREARNHPRRNSLQMALGSGHQYIHPQIDSFPIAAGDRILICSDGLTDGLWDRHVDEYMKLNPENDQHHSAAQKLVDESIDRSGKDNTTAMVIDILRET